MMFWASSESSMVFCAFLIVSSVLVEAGPATKPHVLFVLADDYGHGSLGVHRRAEQGALGDQARAEVHTPNLDGLLDSGVHLTNHYSYKICAPSRASLQSGRLAVHVNVVNAGPLVHNPHDPVSGYAGIPRNMTGMAQKLRSAGYRTHMVGKWDAGMATPDHTPLGRGYETWLGYFQHANDYWKKDTSLGAVGSMDQCLNMMKDFSWYNSTYHGGVFDPASLSNACEKSHEDDPECYEEHVFKKRGLEIINNHNSSEPLFLFYAFHLVHTPLQIPLAYLDKIDKIVSDAGRKPFDSDNRRLLSAMVLYMDEVVGELVKALEARGMWEETLLVFIADNGGAIYEPGAGNNHPLKGGKYSDFQGGVRTNAFLSGGFIPPHLRGTAFDGLMSIADWYGTLCEIAGVDSFDKRAQDANSWLAAQGLPLLAPVDSVPQWNHILNKTIGRNKALHLSENAVILWPYKLVTGVQSYAKWTGTLFPNCSTVHSFHNDQGPMFVDLKVFGMELKMALRERKQREVYWQEDCGNGCLYNLDSDPTEHINLAEVETETLAKMQKILATLNADIFRPERGESTTAACKTALNNCGFFGPFVDADDWNNPVPMPGCAKRASKALKDVTFDVFGNPLVKTVVHDVAQAIFPAFPSLMTQFMVHDACRTEEENVNV